MTLGQATVFTSDSGATGMPSGIWIGRDAMVDTGLDWSDQRVSAVCEELRDVVSAIRQQPAEERAQILELVMTSVRAAAWSQCF